MAHRSDLIQVHQDFPAGESTETFVDPVCGKKLTRKESRSVLFKDGEALHFCSKECREKYQAALRKPAEKAA